MPEKTYDHNQIELKWHERWAERTLLQGRGELHQAQVLRARDAALPERRAAHRPHPQLLDRRRARPLHVDARLQRAAPDGLGRLRSARRKRRHRQQAAAARMDARQHREDEAHSPPLRLLLRLGPRGHHLRARILPLEPVVLPAHDGARPGLPQAGARQLVPLCATVLANEQVVDGCCWRHETGRWSSARSSMVPAHHRLRGRTAAATSRSSKAHGPSACSPCSATGSVAAKARKSISQLKGMAAVRVFTTRVDTIFGATCMILAPEHRLVATLLGAELQAHAKRMMTRGRSRVRAMRRRKASTPACARSIRTAARRCRSGWATSCSRVTAPAQSWPCPAHDQRDFEFCRKYGVEVRPVIRPTAASWPTRGHDRGLRRLRHLKIPASGPASKSEEARREMAAQAERKASANPPSPTGSRTGASPASAIGAPRSP